MRVAVDTNVFVTALLHGATPRRVYNAFLKGSLTPVFSSETLAELIDVLSRPELRVLTSPVEVKQLLAVIKRDGLHVRPRRRVRLCRDIKDNIILDAALAGRVDCIVTGDKDLLALHPFRGILILKPSSFLQLLSE